MEYPYDVAKAEPGLVAVLTVLRSEAVVDQPSQEFLDLASSVKAKPLAAFAHTLGTHASGPDFSDFEATAEPLEENGYLKEFEPLLSEAGHSIEDGMMIGNTGGGAEGLFMIADSSKPGGYVIYAFAYDGEPYENGSPLLALGQFFDLLRWLDGRNRGLDEVWTDLIA